METDDQIQKKVERQFKLELAAVRELNALSERFLREMSAGRGMRDKADSIIAFSAVRETTTFQATLRLVEFGFGRQAMMLNRSIRTWIANWNDEPKPYVWHKSADEILGGLASDCQRINDLGH